MKSKLPCEMGCGQSFNARELRKHIPECRETKRLLEAMLEEHLAKYGSPMVSRGQALDLAALPTLARVRERLVEVGQKACAEGDMRSHRAAAKLLRRIDRADGIVETRAAKKPLRIQ